MGSGGGGGVGGGVVVVVVVVVFCFFFGKWGGVGGTYDTILVKLEEINIKAIRIITFVTEKPNIAKLSLETSTSSITEIRDRAMPLMCYKVFNNLLPDYLSHDQLLPNVNGNMVKYDLRNNDEIKLPFSCLETFRRSFIPYALKLWNLLSFQDHKKYLVLYYAYYGQHWANVYHPTLDANCVYQTKL